MARIISQNRGRGGPNYRSPRRGFLPIKYAEKLNGDKRIVDIIHEPGRTVPLMVFECNGNLEISLCPKGVYTGQVIKEKEIVAGNILNLTDIPENTQVCNIELTLNDGGKLLRSSGLFGIITKKTDTECTIKVKTKYIVVKVNARATIGILAGDNKLFKPLLKASSAIYKAKNKARKGYSVSRVAMNHQDHPFGSSGPKHTKKPRQCARSTPPGGKVGSIAPKRQGYRK